jgi:hypothetical protein
MVFSSRHHTLPRQSLLAIKLLNNLTKSIN